MPAPKVPEPSAEKVVPATDATAVDAAPKGFDPTAIRSASIGPQAIHFAPANCRPPGRILDQDTANAGVWVSADGTSWRKSDQPGIATAIRLALGQSSVDAAIKRLGIG